MKVKRRCRNVDKMPEFAIRKINEHSSFGPGASPTTMPSVLSGLFKVLLVMNELRSIRSSPREPGSFLYGNAYFENI